MNDDIVRIVKIIEYRGPRRAVEAALAQGLVQTQTTRVFDSYDSWGSKEGTGRLFLGKYTIAGSTLPFETLVRNVPIDESDVDA